MPTTVTDATAATNDAVVALAGTAATDVAIATTTTATTATIATIATIAHAADADAPPIAATTKTAAAYYRVQLGLDLALGFDSAATPLKGKTRKTSEKETTPVGFEPTTADWATACGRNRIR